MSVNLPSCSTCGEQDWNGTYQAQVERHWSISHGTIAPTLDHEGEDFGEWEAPSCAAGGEIANETIRDRVMDGLLGLQNVLSGDQ